MRDKVYYHMSNGILLLIYSFSKSHDLIFHSLGVPPVYHQTLEEVENFPDDTHIFQNF